MRAFLTDLIRCEPTICNVMGLDDWIIGILGFFGG